jgi:hypothetical protein
MPRLHRTRADPVGLAFPIATPTMDATATLATHIIYTHGCTTLTLTNPDMFDGSSTTAYLDSGNQLPAVLRSAAAQDELAATTDQLSGAVAGSQMTITHTGRLRVAPGVVRPPWSARNSLPISSPSCPC